MKTRVKLSDVHSKLTTALAFVEFVAPVVFYVPSQVTETYFVNLHIKYQNAGNRKY